MRISAEQCRAARSLLNWTQEQLAISAGVSRATIADFEANIRQPMKNNLKSLEACIFSAGVELLPEQGSAGVGVRFRERKLEYVSNVRIDRFHRAAKMRMRYAGDEFLCVIQLDAIDDHHGANFSSDEEYRKAISDMLHLILRAAERYASTHVCEGELKLNFGMIDASAVEPQPSIREA